MNKLFSTPDISSSKKRDLSSPDDLSLSKKNKLASQSSVDSDTSLSNSPEIMASPTYIVLDDAAIKSIALTLKDSIQTELNTMLKSTVESVIKGVMDGLQSEINILKAENEALRSENSELQYRVDALEFRSDADEQYSRRDNLRISGIHEEKDENTDEKVLKISSDLDLGLSLADISVSYRVGKPKSNNRPRDILVKFSTRRSRDLFL